MSQNWYNTTYGSTMAAYLKSGHWIYYRPWLHLLGGFLQKGSRVSPLTYSLDKEVSVPPSYRASHEKLAPKSCGSQGTYRKKIHPCRHEWIWSQFLICSLKPTMLLLIPTQANSRPVMASWVYPWKWLFKKSSTLKCIISAYDWTVLLVWRQK